jgi:26S proteasome regulatory subunit N10
MVLEATVLVLDNSEWMRNGDYTPSRIEAQSDATIFLFNAKTRSNPENTVGMITMAGKSPEVMVTLTSDIGKVLTALHNIKLSGNAHFTTGVQIAQLALKHRQNKNQKQRIIVFVGSPVVEDEKTLVKLGKKLKKNNIAIDLINFGEEEENTSKLEAFINAVNNSDNSHLVTIPPGPHILSDVLMTSPIVIDEDGAAPSGFAGGNNDFEFGVDPNIDPELALALRISLEEEKMRQEQEAKKKMEESKAEATSSDNNQGLVSTDEDDMLAKALAMSMNTGDDDVLMEDEDEDIAKAIALSMAEANGTNDNNENNDQDLASALTNLPGINSDDPRIKDAVKELEKDKKKDDKK